MQAYRTETTLTQDGTLTVSNLPLRAGEAVEIIIATARVDDCPLVTVDTKILAYLHVQTQP